MASTIDNTKPAAGSPTTQSVRDNFTSARNEINSLLRMTEDVVSSVGTSTAYAATFQNAVVFAGNSVDDGIRVTVKAHTACGFSPTININGTGAKNIVHPDGSNLIANEISGSSHYLDLVYNQSTDNWVLMNPKSVEADKLSTARNIALTGNITGNADFDGSGNISIATAVSSQVGLAAYPIGSIYISTNSANPSTIFGGSWVAFSEGKVLVGVDANDTDFDTAEEVGGSKTHTLTENEIPSHTHDISFEMSDNYSSTNGDNVEGAPGTQRGTKTYTSTSFGGGQAHNNLQPYITVYMWKRTL